MTSDVVDINALPAFTMEPEGGSKVFGGTIADIDGALGLSMLGAMFVTVEPGKRAFPFHSHLGNDEMFVILEGEGTFRIGKAEHKVSAGMVCGAPKGGPDTAHQLINTGNKPLKYIGISTRQDPDVVEYPDSGKFAALAVFPGEDWMSAHLRFVGRTDSAVDYWDGEDA